MLILTTPDATHVYQLPKITWKDFVETGFNNTNLSPLGLHGINLRITDPPAYKKRKRCFQHLC